jgi:hypothetical protein
VVGDGRLEEENRPLAGMVEDREVESALALVVILE